MRLFAVLGFLFAVAAPAWAQDREDEDQLTPEQSMDLLRDVHGLMRKSEELLDDSMTRRSEEKQRVAIEKMQKLIREARAGQGAGRASDERRESRAGASRWDGAGRAEKPYPPARVEAPSKFRSSADRAGQWGNLPPRVREAMLHGKRDIDEYPEEFRRVLAEYMKRIMGGD